MPPPRSAVDCHHELRGVRSDVLVFGTRELDPLGAILIGALAQHDQGLRIGRPSLEAVVESAEERLVRGHPRLAKCPLLLHRRAFFESTRKVGELRYLRRRQDQEDRNMVLDPEQQLGVLAVSAVDLVCESLLAHVL